MSPQVMYFGYVLLCTQATMAPDEETYTCVGHDKTDQVEFSGLTRQLALDHIAICNTEPAHHCTISPPKAPGE